MVSISSAEWEVMRVLWAKGEVTSSEIIAILANKQDWSASTVKTLLGRLADKGYLTSQRQGRRFLYQALVTEEEANRQAMEAVLDRICQTKQAALWRELLTEIPMTADDVAQIQEVLAEKVLVDQVTCNCVPGQCNCANHMEVS